MHYRQRGFTLVELLATIGLVTILMTLGVFAARNLWLKRALYGAQDEVVANMRQMAERSIAESHPIVYGVKFTNNSNAWSLVQYDPRKPSNKCSTVENKTFGTGVSVSDASFADYVDTNNGNVNVSTLCGGGGTTSIAFFFARGSATSGNVRITEPQYSPTVLRTCITAITGRVRKC